MRIVAYNIYRGGEGRADPIAEVVQSQRPDMVALVEADRREVIERIANRLGMDFVQAHGARRAVALLSHWPIVQSINHGRLRRELTTGLLEALVRDPYGVEWPVGVVHLRAHAGEADEDIRLREIDALLDVFAPHRQAGRAHLLAGDFNATSPIQTIDPARCRPATQEEWHANGGQIPRRAMQRLFEAGYVDTLQATRGESAREQYSFTTQFPAQRIDYVLAWGLAQDQVTSAWIERDRLATYASDHYPVGAELRPAGKSDRALGV